MSAGTPTDGWYLAAGAPVLAVEGRRVSVQVSSELTAQVGLESSAVARWALPQEVPDAWTSLAVPVLSSTSYTWQGAGLTLPMAPRFQRGRDGQVACASLRDKGPIVAEGRTNPATGFRVSTDARRAVAAAEIQLSGGLQ